MEELLPPVVRDVVGSYLQHDEAKRLEEYAKWNVLTPEYILLNGAGCYHISSGDLSCLGEWPNIERIRVDTGYRILVTNELISIILKKTKITKIEILCEQCNKYTDLEFIKDKGGVVTMSVHRVGRLKKPKSRRYFICDCYTRAVSKSYPIVEKIKERHGLFSIICANLFTDSAKRNSFHD